MLETQGRDLWVMPFGRGKRGMPVPKATVAGELGNVFVRMAHDGLPVIPGVVLGTAFCELFFDHGRAFPDEVLARLKAEIEDFEQYLKLDLKLKLPVSMAVRVSPVVAVPGLMPARRNLQLDGSETARQRLLEVIIEAFDSWGSERAELFQRLNDEAARTGMAVVFHAMGENLVDDGHRVSVHTRNPRTGELAALEGSAAEQAILIEFRDQLERHFSGAVEFSAVVNGHGGVIVSANSQKMSGQAILRSAIDLVKRGILDEREALMNIPPASIDELLHPTVDPNVESEPICNGIAASPGAVSGQIAFSVAGVLAHAARGERAILVTSETTPEDISSMKRAVGILTLRGGVTSHAAVVARGLGKPCITGAVALRMDKDAGTLSAGNVVLREGDKITIDGVSGEVFEGVVPTLHQSPTGDLEQVMDWAENFCRMQVRANADTPADAQAAMKFKADGIGLCRTEHMFFEADRIGSMRQVILSEDEDTRKNAMNQLLDMQRNDFVEMFTIMAGHSVAIRLLDPPLHEFLPRSESDIAALAVQMGLDYSKARLRVNELTEANPMLGHRGCRLLISRPDITHMQARAIFEGAVLAGQKTGRSVRPEILVPLVGLKREIDFVRRDVDQIAKEVADETGHSIDYSVGTMIELPRACLLADELAESAEFFSFGTNDLTQTIFGMSRDDAGAVLNDYAEMGVLEADPFRTIDIAGVGELMRVATEKGRSVRSSLSVGICGEHAGDPASIDFCESMEMQSISCSPYRVPMARLSAAQSACRMAARKR